jgi:predicted ATPase
MINELKIKGFKSLLGVAIPFRRLTVLVGENASGKSSVIQTLLLLRQSCEDDGTVKGLQLGGSLYEGGTAGDVINPLAVIETDNSRTLSFELKNSVEPGLSNDAVIYQFRYDREKEEAVARTLDTTVGAGTPLEAPLRPSTKDDYFIYLSAERWGPRISYPLPSSESLAGPIGKSGEFTAAYLRRALNTGRMASPKIGVTLAKATHELGKYSSNIEVEQDDRDKVSSSDNRLTTLANRALTWVIPGAQYQVEEHSNMDMAQLSFNRMDPKNPKPERPTHIGFGLSYALPVIVGALALDEKGLFIAENVESHLHPLSQSRMGVFLAIAASDGPQVLLETHSDHIVNGIRLAIKFGWIRAEDVIFHFFRRSVENGSTSIVSVETDDSGALTEWPVGFLDQIANDLSML